MTRWGQRALVAVWLGTAAVSLRDGGHAGAAWLTAQHVPSAWALALVRCGAGWDFLLGVLLALWPQRAVRVAAAIGMLAMTAIASVLMPALWLDPLGPLLKNLPLLALLLDDEHLPAR